MVKHLLSLAAEGLDAFVP